MLLDLLELCEPFLDILVELFLDVVGDVLKLGVDTVADRVQTGRGPLVQTLKLGL